MARKKYLQNKSKRNQRSKGFFILHLKKSLLITLIWMLSIIFHHLIELIFNIQEKVLLFISVYLIPLYLFIAVIYTLVHHKRKGW